MIIALSSLEKVIRVILQISKIIEDPEFNNKSVLICYDSVLTINFIQGKETNFRSEGMSERFWPNLGLS